MKNDGKYNPTLMYAVIVVIALVVTGGIWIGSLYDRLDSSVPKPPPPTLIDSYYNLRPTDALFVCEATRKFGAEHAVKLFYDQPIEDSDHYFLSNLGYRCYFGQILRDAEARIEKAHDQD
jgi:hypothetical protein